MTDLTNTHYDVIVVGGRAAGSTLAAYLGKQQARVLLLERALFPMPPAASSPIIYASTMAMLDEIGADEAAYAAETPRIHRMVMADDPTFTIALPEVQGRDYGYAPDRARFDAALWDAALAYPTVTGLQGFHVSDLLWDDAGMLVIGVVGRHNGQERRYTARCVVGADGRFSVVARKAEAAEYDKHEANPTSLLYAYWRNVQPYDDQGAAAVAYGAPSGALGWGYLVMDSADGTAAVTIEGQAAKLEKAGGSIEEHYLELLARHPALWARLQHAERVTKVHGMRKVGNLYRAPGGPGWVLVGDAYHQKDPLDGQGIYDAVFTARTLAKALHAWLRGDMTWAAALAWYDERARAETSPQYAVTLERVRSSIYPPDVPLPRQWIGTPVRWLFNDPQYQRRTGLILNRAIDPRKVTDVGFAMVAMLRGGLRELSSRLADPADKR